MFGTTGFVRVLACAMAAIFAAGCDKLSYTPDADPIKFGGVKSAFLTKEGKVVLSWDNPEADSRPVQKYEIFMNEIEGPASSETPAEGTAALALNSPGGLIVDMLDPSAPVTTGKVVGVIEGATSFSVDGLSSGNYAFQVKALDDLGNRDENSKVLILTIDQAIRFAGIETAEIVDDKIVLKWQPFVTPIKGEPIHYIVFEGLTFADHEKIAIVDEGKAFFEIPLSEKAPGLTVTYGVRVKDPTGTVDNNVALKTVQIPEDNSKYLGCLRADPKGANEIILEVQFPNGADKVNVYRNGKIVFTTTSPENVVFEDREGLQEGVTYTYKCEFERLGFKKVGTEIKEVTTLNTNPPTFSGVTNVTADQAGAVKVSWGVATGVPAKSFKIFVSPGQNVDWDAEPFDIEETGKLSKIVTGLGDEIPYSIGVRACSQAKPPVCDTNTISIGITLPDAGPPKTVGATEAKVIDGKMHITAPWKHADGAVLKRKVYIYTGTNEADINNFAKYTLRKTFVVNNLIAPETELVIENLLENTQYNIVVRDEGPSGATSDNMKVVSKNSGDLAPPAFGGITSLTAGPEGQKETSLTAGFAAIAAEVLSPGGASFYVVQIKAGGGNACNTFDKTVEFTASPYTAGQSYDYIVTGLLPKTLYSICMKAKDSAGNISEVDSYLTKTTIDTTPPAFDGVQTLDFNQDKAELAAAWNSSLSDDVLEYKIRIWSNNPTPVDNEILTITKPHPAFKTGFKFDKTIISFGSGDTVYVVVDACDNGGIYPGGSQNCTKYPLSAAVSITLADIEPPPGFAGIAAENQQLTPAEGTISVTWVAPADWSDYAGFKIYTVDNNGGLEFIKQCACISVGCPSQPVSCDLVGLDPFRTYNLHVRAYDAAGNLTLLDPFTRSAKARTSDTTAPTFSSNLALSFEGGFANLTWNAATDNQYPLEPGANIKYMIYRKSGTTFGSPTAPEIDGLLLGTVEERFHADNKDFASGVVYYYTVCAIDGSNNRKCDANIKNFTTPDLVPPTIGSFTTTKTDDDKIWSLQWVVTDNKPDPVLIKVYKTTSSDAPGPVTELDSVVAAAYDITNAINLKGPINTDVYVNYLLVAEDQAGNKASATLSVFSQNRIEVSAVKTSEGPGIGGNLLVLTGSGFHSSTIVKMGGSTGSPCSGAQKITKEIMTCSTPGMANGTYDIYVQNSDGSSFTLPGSYSYCSLNSCTQICNNPDLWQTNFAKGIGTSADPFIICNPTHLGNVRTAGNYKYFKMGANVDLKDFTANDFLPLYTHSDNYNFIGYFDGDGHVVANYKYHAPPGTVYVGLFRALYGGYDIKNVGLINADIKGNYYVGGLVGFCNSTVAVIQNVFVTGSVEGESEQVGGVAGRGSCPLIGAKASATVKGTRYIGGIVGYKDYTGVELQYEGTVTATGAGSDCYVGAIAGRWGGNGQDLENPTAKADVNCTGATGHYTGGLFGTVSNMNIIGPKYSGTVSSTYRYVGGIAGSGSVTIDNAKLNAVDIQATGPYVGGITGSLGGLIKNSSFDGDISTPNGALGGLVGYMNSSTGGIENSHANVNLDCNNCSSVGGLAGQAYHGYIKDSYATGTVKGTSYIGGLLGYHQSSGVFAIESSHSNVDVDASGNLVGGLVGYIEWGISVANSYATGTVKGNDEVGGLIGRCRVSATGVIDGSYAVGDVTGNNQVGGFCGRIYNGYPSGPEIDISDSYSTGTVNGSGTDVGGFVGRVENSVKIVSSRSASDVYGTNQTGGFIGQGYYDNIYVENCFATGDVNGDTNVGGFIGHFYSAQYSRIKDSYATGKVVGDNQVGGFAGATADMVERVFSTGEVKRKIPGVGQIGGLVGIYRNNTAYNGLGTIMNSYWNTETSKVSSSYGGGTGLTTNDMKLQASYQDFDFVNIWSMPDNDYPILRWTTD